MLIKEGDILSNSIGILDAVCIPTNGYVKKNGEAVMGAGLAKEIKEMLEGIEQKLGMLIKGNGNIVQVISKEEGTYIIAFPVKPIYVKAPKGYQILPHLRNNFINKDFVPGFAVYADLKIIEESCKQLLALVNKTKFETVAMPLVGCGNGGLKPNVVIPILKKYFHEDDRFILYVKDNIEFIKFLYHSKENELTPDDIEWTKQ